MTLRVLLLLLVVVGSALADEAETIRSTLRKAKEQRAIPAVSVAVSRGGELIFNEAIGFADLEAKTRASAASIYQLGSISKQFTAAGVMRLVERGELKLDDRASTFFPAAHPSWSEVRISHLLHQTSGIREFFSIPAVGKALTDLSRKPEELLGFILREPLGFAPGERWSYSNSNYTLLAAIIEKITGAPYEQYLAREFFEPLGLGSLHHCESQPTRAELAVGYDISGGKPKRAAIENMNWARGDGGLCGTAADLIRWTRALARGQVVNAESYREMTAARETADGIRSAYGFGLSLVPLDGAVAKVSHNGAIGGFMSTLAYYPEQDVAIAVLTNRSRIWPQVIEKEISRALFSRPAPSFRTVPLSRSDLRRFAGTYEIGLADLPLDLVQRGARLRLEAQPPIPSADLRYVGDGRFVAEDEPDAIELQFSQDDRDTAERVRFLMAGMHWYGRRVAEPK